MPFACHRERRDRGERERERGERERGEWSQ
jgi:hypothetical protein